MMANSELERVCKEAVVTYFKVLFSVTPGGTEESHEKLQFGLSVSWPKFEPGTIK
jgi:hypothetical protein